MPRALMIVFSNPTSTDTEAEYNAWYDTHLRDVVAMPGVTAAQRYQLSDIPAEGGIPWPDHRYMAVYEVEAEDLAAVSAEMAKRDDTELMPISPTLDRRYTVHYWVPFGSRCTQPADHSGKA